MGKDIKEYIKKLYSKNNKEAYASLIELKRINGESNEIYKYFENFAEMLDCSNSYIRSRGLILIGEVAKWDNENKINKIISRYLEHILDEKPITSRQCIKGLEKIIYYKPDLANEIKDALLNADTSKYAESMRPLIEKDILAFTEKI